MNWTDYLIIFGLPTLIAAGLIFTHWLCYQTGLREGIRLGRIVALETKYALPPRQPTFTPAEFREAIREQCLGRGYFEEENQQTESET